jgi:hypothetical protein
MIVCAANKGRAHRRILATARVGGRLEFRPDCWAGGRDSGEVGGTVEMSAVTVRCPEHGDADVTATELDTALSRAKATNQRAEIKVTPTKHRRIPRL